jgi:hypothetical protein
MGDRPSWCAFLEHVAFDRLAIRIFLNGKVHWPERPAFLDFSRLVPHRDVRKFDGKWIAPDGVVALFR